VQLDKHTGGVAIFPKSQHNFVSWVTWTVTPASTPKLTSPTIVALLTLNILLESGISSPKTKIQAFFYYRLAALGKKEAYFRIKLTNLNLK
jgi:hypothetical protein